MSRPHTAVFNSDQSIPHDIFERFFVVLHDLAQNVVLGVLFRELLDLICEISDPAQQLRFLRLECLDFT